MENPPKEKPESESLSSQFAAWFGAMWKKVNAWTEKDRSDNAFVLVLKVLLQVLLFLVFLALSPLILIGFILAFIAAI